jgi:hypothetical protein
MSLFNKACSSHPAVIALGPNTGSLVSFMNSPRLFII